MLALLASLALCLLQGTAGALSLGAQGLRQQGFLSPALNDSGAALTSEGLRRIASGNWTGLMDLRYDPDTLEVLQVADHGTNATSSKPWTVFFSSKGNKVGQHRTERLRARCAKQGLKCMRLSSQPGKKTRALAVEFLVGLKVWEKDVLGDAAIFAEDDTVFIRNFRSELHRSIQQLPSTWQVFWLCPGFLHARRVPKPIGSAFHLHPEGKLLSEPRKSNGGRVFLDWPVGDKPFNRNGILAGGPATGVLKKGARPLFKQALKAALAAGDETAPVDIIFKNLGMEHKSQQFLAAEPQLCVEERSIRGSLEV